MILAQEILHVPDNLLQTFMQGGGGWGQPILGHKWVPSAQLVPGRDTHMYGWFGDCKARATAPKLVSWQNCIHTPGPERQGLHESANYSGFLTLPWGEYFVGHNVVTVWLVCVLSL